MNRLVLISILSALSMMGALSIDAYLPALPSMAKEFGVSLATAQQTLTVYLLGFAFTSLFYGTISDSFGRRPVILISLSLYFLSSIGAGCTGNLEWLLFFRILQGASAAGGPVVGDAIVVDLLSGVEAQRAMAYVATIFGIAPAVAPILGGWLQAAFGWRSIFFFIAFFTLVLLAMCVFLLPESLSRSMRRSFHLQAIVASYWRVGCNPTFIFRCLGNGLSFLGVFTYVGAAPVFIVTILHLTIRDFGWLFLPLIGGLTLGSFVAGRLSHKFTPGALIQMAYFIMGIAATLNLVYASIFSATIPWAVLPICLYGFGMALATPVMTVVILEMFPSDRGLASSLLAFFIMILFALGAGLIAPLLFDSNLHLAWGLCAGFALSLLAWWLAPILSRHASPRPDPE